jgi:hypothetical protein
MKRLSMVIALAAVGTAALAQGPQWPKWFSLDVNGVSAGYAFSISGGWPLLTQVPITNPIDPNFAAFGPGVPDSSDLKFAVDPLVSPGIMQWISDQMAGKMATITVVGTPGGNAKRTANEPIFSSATLAAFVFPETGRHRPTQADPFPDPPNVEMHLHAQNIVHRDLAARNLLVQPSGWDTSNGGILIDGIDTSGVLQTKKLPVRWSAPEVLKAVAGAPVITVGALHLVVDAGLAKPFYDWYNKQTTSGGARVTFNGSLVDNLAAPVIGLSLNNLWIYECYLGDDGNVHVSLRCDSARLLPTVNK